MAWEDAVKFTLGWRPEIKIPISLPKYGYSESMATFFPSFPDYGILYHIKNAWVFPSISHNIGECSKIRPMGRSWLWEHPLHQIPITWMVHRFSNEFLV